MSEKSIAIIDTYIKNNISSLAKKFSYIKYKETGNTLKEKDNICSNLKRNMLTPNMIVNCRIQNILSDKKTNKQMTIFVKILSVIGYIECKDNSSNKTKAQNNTLLTNLYNDNITGIINEENIYDKMLSYFNDELSKNIKVGNTITALIIKLNKDSIMLSMKNSLIKNKKQLTLEGNEIRIKHLLGQVESNKFDYFNEQYFSDKCNTYHLNKILCDNTNPFPYDKIRKVQNYDWSDIYTKKGEEEHKIGNYEKALEYYNEAEALDPLNINVYERRISIYLELGNIDSLKKACKSYLMIKPNDNNIKEILSNIINGKINDKNKNGYLNKKRKQN